MVAFAGFHVLSQVELHLFMAFGKVMVSAQLRTQVETRYERYTFRRSIGHLRSSNNIHIVVGLLVSECSQGFLLRLIE